MMLSHHYIAPCEGRYTFAPESPPHPVAQEQVTDISMQFFRCASVLLFIAPAAMLPAPSGAAASAGEGCREALLADDPGAERACSDAIDFLNAGPADPARRMQLAAAYGNRALSRLGAGDLEGAAADFDQALQLAPEHPALHLNRGNLFLTAGDPEAALAEYRIAAGFTAGNQPGLTLPTVRQAALANSLLAYRAMGDPQRAEQLLAAMESQSAAEEAHPPGINPPPSHPPATDPRPPGHPQQTEAAADGEPWAPRR